MSDHVAMALSGAVCRVCVAPIARLFGARLREQPSHSQMPNSHTANCQFECVDVSIGAPKTRVSARTVADLRVGHTVVSFVIGTVDAISAFFFRMLYLCAF